ncbi:hypothetical protein HPB47_000901, partial [Ixodes persulcatus]
RGVLPWDDERESDVRRAAIVSVRGWTVLIQQVFRLKGCHGRGRAVQLHPDNEHYLEALRLRHNSGKEDICDIGCPAYTSLNRLISQIAWTVAQCGPDGVPDELGALPQDPLPTGDIRPGDLKDNLKDDLKDDVEGNVEDAVLEDVKDDFVCLHSLDREQIATDIRERLIAAPIELTEGQLALFNGQASLYLVLLHGETPLFKSDL